MLAVGGNVPTNGGLRHSQIGDTAFSTATSLGNAPWFAFILFVKRTLRIVLKNVWGPSLHTRKNTHRGDFVPRGVALLFV